MKIGLGKAVITPPVGFSLTGYFNDRRSTGIRDELYVISCVIEDKGKTFAITSVDLCWVGEETVKKAKKIVYRETGIPNIGDEIIIDNISFFVKEVDRNKKTIHLFNENDEFKEISFDEFQKVGCQNCSKNMGNT